MSTLLALVPFAGCTAMMLLCTRMMRRGDCATTTTAENTEVAELRTEVAQLRARLDPASESDLGQSPVN